MKGSVRVAVTFACVVLVARDAAAGSLIVPKPLLQRLLATKRTAVPFPDGATMIIDGFPAKETTSGIFLLMSLEALDRDSPFLPSTPAILDEAAPFQRYINTDPRLRWSADLKTLDVLLPNPVVDHQAAQTLVRDQGVRPTCVAHATLAAMEARLGIADLNLSEDFAHHAFMASLGSTCCRQPDTAAGRKADVNTIDAAVLLQSLRIPTEQDPSWQYNRKWPQDINATDTCYEPTHDNSPASSPSYNLASIDILSAKSGLQGPSIRNPAYLEVLLALGYDIVIALGVAWQSGDEKSTIDVVIENGQPRAESGGHAMLLVGYDRPSGYFVAKNSLGPAWGYAGYARLSYDYITTYARYGFIVKNVVP
ncbi:MAG TPA: C1 family peptidase [Thermoanaerobaculia bacterium]|nr:C1 family peptidase [Thermoanaerobaculia bacterium]